MLDALLVWSLAFGTSVGPQLYSFFPVEERERSVVHACMAWSPGSTHACMGASHLPTT